MNMQTTRRALLGSMALAPVSGTALSARAAPVPTQSDFARARAAYLDAECKTSLHHERVYLPAREAWIGAGECEGPELEALSQAVDESNQLSDAASDLETDMLLARVGSLQELRTKLKEAYRCDGFQSETVQSAILDDVNALIGEAQHG